MSGLLLVATKCIDVRRADEWADWYHSDHLPSLVGGTITAASRWRLDGAPPPGGPGPGRSHVTRLDIAGDPTRAAAERRERVDGLRRDGRIHPAHAETAVDVWVRHGPDVVAPGEHGPPTAMIVAEVMCTDPAREAEWDQWYDDQHLPDMLASGAFASASRWLRAPRRGTGCDHLTVYEVAGTDATEAVRRSGAAMPGIVAAGRKHECHTGGHTMALDAE